MEENTSTTIYQVSHGRRSEDGRQLNEERREPHSGAYVLQYFLTEEEGRAAFNKAVGEGETDVALATVTTRPSYAEFMGLSPLALAVELLNRAASTYPADDGAHFAVETLQAHKQFRFLD